MIPEEVANCTICAKFLPHHPRPVVSIHPEAKVLIIGQAPDRKVHDSGVPWNDASGNRLREWLGVSKRAFYDPRNFAILPMGFCFPGSGKSGDLPPRPECAPQWHKVLIDMMPNIQLTLLIGQYALKHYLGSRREKNLTETVRQWKNYFPEYLPLPHPSPRNQIWLRKNAWFEQEVLPCLENIVQKAL